ncbi:Polycystic kidney disease 2-like 2 protein [Hondaea fermentalgiana]|uniref:Polycystic kidney disease 2-like 2 protein n=1 Tax=Hondaea fermentalgiana TaxID=2315210 RepID=A0A2R5GGJ6_9STRA|nr:Polycystic kidney disease 2-like 2 protein [Hondaea fermentalgiana]|eukprot:GBG28878.1 Polycystic kidney disease 2-like 2 protein [Hondaea fermentalgiana]
MRGGGIASTLSARRLDLEEDDAPSKAVPADKVDTGVKGQLYKPGRKGDVEVLSGKALVEKIHEQLAQAQENGANYCNLLWFILYVGLYVIILGMQRSPPEAFMVEESIKNSLFGESTRTVEYSTGEISTTMESSSHIFEWLENSVIKSIFVDPTCGDGICDTPLEYPQWLDYGCSEDCGTYSSKLTSAVVVNVTAAFEDDEEIEDASWNLCSITHDVCYFSSSQLFTTRNESQVHEVDLLDGVWEVQLKASRGGIVGQIYTESSQLVTVAEIVNGTIGGNETSDANNTDTFVEYYTYVDTTRTIIAEWTACKDTSDSVSQEDLQLIQQSCEDATGEVKRICSAEDCEACSEAKCSLYADCAFNETLDECYTLTCGNEPQACPYCADEDTCEANADCIWDESCKALCSVADCASEACTVSQHACDLQTEVCGSMSTCEACSDDPTMCEKKNGCEFDYQSWSCSGFQEITSSCDEASGGFCTSALLQNGFCDDECNIGECGYDQGACADTANLLTYICSDMCYCNMLADDVCDAACDTAACGFDLGDCCERVFTSELDVQFELWNHFTPETVERLTPDPLLPRSRYLATVNRLIGGVLVLQTRYERGNCSSQRFAALANDCFTGEQSTAPFGADPVFLRSSSLNTDETVYKSKSSYYNLSDPEQVSTLGLPYGFHYFAASSNISAGGSIEGFPVYFDANLGSTRASEFLAYMQEGFYLDADTESVDVLMVTYNAALRMFANTKVTFSFEYGGRVRMAYTVQSFRAEPYATDADLTRLFFETVFVILTALNFVSELRDFFRDFWRTGKPLTYFRSLWNYVDMVNIWLLVWNVISWATFFTTWTLQYDPKERYNVYLDLDAEANFLATNETGMNEMLSFMVLSNQMSDQMGIYTALNGAALVLMVFRVLKVLDFQQRMGLVTRTISNAAVDLAHFAVLFFVVFSLYGSLAYIIFGSAIVGFSTLPRSLNSCFSILLGDISVIDELLVHPNVGAAVIFYYSFIFLAYFILMNILLAILVEAFVEVKRSAEFSKSLPSEVLQILRSSARSLKPFRTENYMADSEIVELLSDWVAESKIIEESEKLGRRTFNTEGFSANSEQLQEVLECELARVRQLTRNDSHLTEVAAVLGHKATSPFDTVLSEDDDDNMSKLAGKIAKNVLHRYGTGTDVVQSRPRIAPAPSSPGNDRASGRRASATLNALRRRTLAFAQGAASPKSRAIRMTRFSQRYASGGKDEQLNSIVDQIIEERVREEDELAED